MENILENSKVSELAQNASKAQLLVVSSVESGILSTIYYFIYMRPRISLQMKVKRFEIALLKRSRKKNLPLLDF